MSLGAGHPVLLILCPVEVKQCLFELVDLSYSFYVLLQVKPCLLSPFYELAGGFLVFKKDVLTERAIVDPWVACAFSPDCLCPGKGCLKFKGHCNNQTRPYSRCHRFDQSALAIILVTLFDYRVSGLVSTDFGRLVHFALGDKVDYFPPEG